MFPGLVVITHGENVLSSTPCDIEELIGCTYEEADTQMFVNASHAVQHSLEKILLITVDTDVVVISTSMAPAPKFDCERLWLAFATGNTFRYIDATAIMDMAQSLGGDKCTSHACFS